uniref:Cytochrome c oxidase subunit 3 n=3 Tax=Magnusiomyces TaxID=1095182 RepID=A0A8E5J5U2_9ASCO|nr:cytochrome c oxidase subunit 3 [Saprochaete ingens]QUX32910.1 cytochrome c oxidase subunit 3 [Magnusiomyces ingens]QUX32932.1 cytochrome c oxidase subunit 3 [Saprochaete ingens]
MLNMHRQQYQLHPFHLVENSPWPILTSFSMFGLAMNTALTSHGYIGNSWWVMLSMINVTYMLFLWFRDIISEGTYLGNHTLAVRNGMNLGFMLFMVSECMFFLGMFWAFGHSALNPTVELGGVWPPLGMEAIGPTELPLLNTMLLLSSGATLTYSHHYLINGNRWHALFGLFITVLLAVMFMMCQYIEYTTASFTMSDGVFGSVFYLGTGFHGFHVLMGMIMLSISYWRMWNYHSTNNHHLGFHTSVLYYHFVDVVWLILFMLVYWWGS